MILFYIVSYVLHTKYEQHKVARLIIKLPRELTCCWWSRCQGRCSCGAWCCTACCCNWKYNKHLYKNYWNIIKVSWWNGKCLLDSSFNIFKSKPYPSFLYIAPWEKCKNYMFPLPYFCLPGCTQAVVTRSSTVNAPEGTSNFTSTLSKGTPPAGLSAMFTVNVPSGLITICNSKWVVTVIIPLTQWVWIHDLSYLLYN